MISQTEDIPLSQEILAAASTAVISTDSDTAADKSASDTSPASSSVSAAPHEDDHWRGILPSTPGYPLTSPQCQNDVSSGAKYACCNIH